MDYCLLHSADFDGPESVLPAIATRGGELGIRRSVVEHGVQVMARAGMISVITSRDGLTYQASETAAPFLRLIGSSFMDRLMEVAEWAVSDMRSMPTSNIRNRIHQVSNQWTEQWTENSLIHEVDGSPGDGSAS